MYFTGKQQLSLWSSATVLICRSYTKLLTTSSDSFQPLGVWASLLPHWEFCVVPFESSTMSHPLLERAATEWNSLHLQSYRVFVDWWLSKLFDIHSQAFRALCKSTTHDLRSSEASFCEASFHISRCFLWKAKSKSIFPFCTYLLL